MRDPRHKFVTICIRDTKEDIQDRRSKIKEEWSKVLGETFEKKLQLYPNIDLTHCVCLGLRSLTRRLYVESSYRRGDFKEKDGPLE